MTRYDVVYDHESIGEMDSCDNGEWVRYEDVKDLLPALKALLSFDEVRWACDEGPSGEGWRSTELLAAWAAVDAAIAKAEGHDV